MAVKAAISLWIREKNKLESCCNAKLTIMLIYPSYFELHVRWLRLLARITYLSKLTGTHSLAAFLKLELFRI
ncbi:hypothetical protein SOASR015_34720 [Pectobacterium carotovorum subsp. carotovorum]|nr:hypothetical protein SOASR015_34720 [Pectobacterium carotovorum subsp. carotovorum]GLX58075.1 hypothetical protein Pcaca02_33840 [Pectobacterium carotovorum subsp. carotovorum]